LIQRRNFWEEKKRFEHNMEKKRKEIMSYVKEIVDHV